MFGTQGECGFIVPVLGMNVASSFTKYGETPFLTSRTISSVVSTWSLGVRSTPSAGMQYRHRRLHFSVSEILR